MATLKTLRILIILSFLVFFCQQLVIVLYEPLLASPVLMQQHHELIELLAKNNLLVYCAAVEMVLMAYSAAALWFAQRIGRYIYILYILLTLADNYLLEVQASSWLGNMFSEIAFLLWGIILALIYCSPLREEISRKKPYQIWRITGLFVLFIGVMILSSYLNSLIGRA